MRFHLVSLDHIPSCSNISSCAFTQKNIKLARMLASKNHTIYFYGTEGSNLHLTEPELQNNSNFHFIQVGLEKERNETYGIYDWKKDGFFRLDPYPEYDSKGKRQNISRINFNKRAIDYINSIKQNGDILLVTMGNFQEPISKAVNLMTVESGIGYEGVLKNSFKVFESYAWMHFIYGKSGVKNGNFWDAVIPNYFDTKQFSFVEKPNNSGPIGKYKDGFENYFLYTGRVIKRKGVDVAAQVAKALGYTLVVAGQGELVSPFEKLNIDKSLFPNVIHVGAVEPEERNRLMGNALVSFAPTYYIEPFGGVNIESQLCGTPVITSDFGAYPETIQHGKTGFRCRTFEQFLTATKQALNLDRKYIRNYAVSNYSMERIADMYEEYWNIMKTYQSKTNGSNPWYYNIFTNEDMFLKNNVEVKDRNLKWLEKYYD